MYHKFKPSGIFLIQKNQKYFSLQGVSVWVPICFILGTATLWVFFWVELGENIVMDRTGAAGTANRTVQTRLCGLRGTQGKSPRGKLCCPMCGLFPESIDRGSPSATVSKEREPFVNTLNVRARTDFITQRFNLETEERLLVNNWLSSPHLSCESVPFASFTSHSVCLQSMVYTFLVISICRASIVS